MNKVFPRLAIIGLVLLFAVFMVAGSIFIYQQQRNSYIDEFKESQQTDLKLLSQLAREALLSQNYALLEWFFNTWGIDFQKVVSLRFENHNGFALSQYQRRKAAVGETITNTNTLLLHDGSYTITITSDNIHIDKKLEHLKLELLLFNSGATLLVILNTWFLFQHFAIRRLHHEIRQRKIAEEKLKHLGVV